MLIWTRFRKPVGSSEGNTRRRSAAAGEAALPSNALTVQLSTDGSGAVPQSGEEDVQDIFMAAFNASLRVEPPPPDQGIVWTTSRGWRVWEEASASTHRGMAAAAVSKASWCSGSIEPVIWHRPYDAPPRWFVRGTREYEAKLCLGAQTWAEGVGQRTPRVSAGAVDAAPRAGRRQAPSIGGQARIRERATEHQPPVGVNLAPAPGPQRETAAAATPSMGSRQAPMECRRAAGCSRSEGVNRRRRRRAVVFTPSPGVAWEVAVGPRRSSWRRTREGSRRRSKASHVIETINGTAWSSLAEYVQGSSGVDVFLMQETHLPPSRVKAEEDWCKARRLRGTLSAATPSGEGGWRGGAGIAARDAYGMTLVPGMKRSELVEGRVVLVHLGGLVRGGYGLATVYLWTSEGMSARNLAILDALGAALRGLGIPFVVGGDWNVGPEVLEATGWAERLRAKIVAPQDVTFVPTATLGDGESAPAQGSRLDYFVVSEMLVPLVQSVRVVETELIAQHKPVRLALNPRLTGSTMRVIRRRMMPGPSEWWDHRGRSLRGTAYSISSNRSWPLRGAVRPP